MEKLILGISIFFTCSITNAQNRDFSNLDKASQEALKKTQALLMDPTQRQKAIDSDPKAKEADAYARKVIGNDPEALQKMYELSASVFEILALQGEADPKKMQEVAEKYGKDPAAFGRNFSPEELKKLKEISESVKLPTKNH